MREQTRSSTNTIYWCSHSCQSEGEWPQNACRIQEILESGELRRAPIKLPGMHIKVFTCAPWNNTRLGNETDHILRTNSETNFGLFEPRDTFTTPDFLWASLLLCRATLRVDISQVGLLFVGVQFAWPRRERTSLLNIFVQPSQRLFPPVCFGSNTMSLCVARYPNTCHERYSEAVTERMYISVSQFCGPGWKDASHTKHEGEMSK